MLFIDQSLFEKLIKFPDNRELPLKITLLKNKNLAHLVWVAHPFFPYLPFPLAAAAHFQASRPEVGSIGGAAIKGPISGAVAFIDVNNDGALDTSTEPYAYTDDDGNYSIATNGETGPIVVITDAGATGLTINAVDLSTSQILSNVTLSAPAGASVVTPTTTVVQELSSQGVSAADVADALGLGGIDILNFNPFADGANAADALKAEQVASQVMTTVKTLASEGGKRRSTAGSEANLSAAFSSIATAVKVSRMEMLLIAWPAVATLDFSDAGSLDVVNTAATSELANLSGLEAADLSTIWLMLNQQLR